MKNVLLFIFLLFPAAAVAGDYYLKVRTTLLGNAGNVSLQSEANAKLYVSIVDSLPSPIDGPVHYPHSLIEAYPKIDDGNWFQAPYGNPSPNYGVIYYSDVPRSVTLFHDATGVKTILKSGDPETTISGGVAILLPDGLVVAPGLSWDTSGNKFAIAAAMPARPVTTHPSDFSKTDGNDPSNVEPRNRNARNNSSDSCVQGYHASGHRQNVTIMAMLPTFYNATCRSMEVYSGPVEYRVRFE